MWLLLACQAPPVAVIDAEPAAGAWPLQVSLDASRSEGRALSYTWDLGDGTSADGESLSTTYGSQGSYLVSLTVEDDRGESASAEVTIEVEQPPCPMSSPYESTGQVTDTELNEISGVAPSRNPQAAPDRYWVHEDSGNPAVLVALDATGAVHARHPVEGEPTDLEDIAVSFDEAAGVSKVYLADIGDNGLVREQVVVLVLPEPDAESDGPVSGALLRLVYPDGPHDAETLLVDPRTQDLFLVTKRLDGQSAVFRKPAPHDSEGPHTLEQVATLAFTGGELIGGAVTGGDISPDGSRIVLRTYLTAAYVWQRDGDDTVAEALAGRPCPVTLASEPQGEAISFGPGPEGSRELVTVSEGEGPSLYRVPLQ